MKLRWARRARDDRRALISFVEDQSPVSAFVLDQRIDEALRRLTEHPHSGRIGRARKTRELVILRTPYIAIYFVDDDGVRIARLIHSAQQWPPRRPA